MITRGHTLLLANSFTYDETADIVYYILAVRETLKLGQESDPLYYSGRSAESDEALTILRKYIRKVNPLPLPLSEDSAMTEQPPCELLISSSAL